MSYVRTHWMICDFISSERPTNVGTVRCVVEAGAGAVSVWVVTSVAMLATENERVFHLRLALVGGCVCLMLLCSRCFYSSVLEAWRQGAAGLAAAEGDGRYTLYLLLREGRRSHSTVRVKGKVEYVAMDRMRVRLVTGGGQDGLGESGVRRL